MEGGKGVCGRRLPAGVRSYVDVEDGGGGGRGRVGVVKIIHFETSHTYRDRESVSIKAQTQSRLVSTEEAVKGIGSRIVHSRLTMSKHERGNLKGELES